MKNVKNEGCWGVCLVIFLPHFEVFYVLMSFPFRKPSPYAKLICHVEICVNIGIRRKKKNAV